MKQLMELKQKMEQAKERLDNVKVESINAAVKVTANGNRKITQVELLDASLPKEKTEALLVEALNEALGKADGIAQAELAQHMPKIPGIN